LARGNPHEGFVVQTKKMPPYGQGQRGLMIIGEGPGEQEDRKGQPWQGRAGNYLSRALRDFDIDLYRDCISLNAVNCRPQGNRTPVPHEVACCRVVMVNPALKTYQPHVILLMGGSAVSSVIGGILQEAQDATIGKWRGFRIPVPSLNAWVCPTFHPSYIMREEKRPEIETVWRNDIEAALKLLDQPVPTYGELRDKVTILRDEDQILRQLDRVKIRKGLFSFDYETTGLRASLHQLVCASFCQSPDRAYAFMYDGQPGPIYDAWRDILADEQIYKLSHNLDFEYQWSRQHFDLEEIVWGWDSMLGAHVLDNRPGICGLKHQAFLQFGIPAYDTKVAPFLLSTDQKNPAALNRIFEFIDRYGEDELLYYNGIDSLVCFWLVQMQMQQLGAKA
jgi:DNA polymerase